MSHQYLQLMDSNTETMANEASYPVKARCTKEDTPDKKSDVEDLILHLAL